MSEAACIHIKYNMLVQKDIACVFQEKWWHLEAKIIMRKKLL